MMLVEKVSPLKQCPVCILEDASFVDSKVSKHDITDQQAADELKVSYRVYAAHYETHVRRRLVTALSTEIVPLRDIVIDKVLLVAESTDRLRKVILAFSERILLNKEPDSKDILALGQMERSLTQNVKDLAMIQGELSMGDTTNIQINIEKAERLWDIVMETAPPEYKKVLLQKLSIE